MSHPRRSARRSPIGRGIRGGIAILLAIVGWASVSQTLAYVVRERDPAWAHRLAFGDGRITALLADKLITADVAPRQRRAADALARSALRQDATAVPAVVVLGLGADLDGDASRVGALFAYSERLSRRDVRTQIWAIENAVARNDIPGALRHYDIALRTSRSAMDLLFPVLAAASAEPQIASSLTRTLVAKPAWGASFVEYVAGSGPGARATARLLRGLHSAGLLISEHAQAVTISRLISHDALDDAWTYYASVRPVAQRRQLRDPGFAVDRVEPSLFDWVPVNDGGITSSVQRSETGGLFEFTAPGSVGGTVLQQAQMLPVGEYDLIGHSVGVDQPEGSRPYWVLTCRDGRELGRVVVTDSASANGAFAGHFTVPDRCPLQLLALVTRPSDAVSGSSGQIDRVQLRPAR